MPFYNTGERAYDSENTANSEIIRELDFREYPFRRGVPYRVLGFLLSAPQGDIYYEYSPTRVEFWVNRKGQLERTFNLEEIGDHLEQNPRIGTRIVARRVAEDGSFLDATPNNVLITEPLFCPHPPKQKK